VLHVVYFINYLGLGVPAIIVGSCRSGSGWPGQAGSAIRKPTASA
jgi:hypothetical protein